MHYKHKLPQYLVSQALSFDEFANGGAQCHAELKNGSVHPGLLVSNATAIVAMRGYSALPFPVEEIARLFQAAEDRDPVERGGWEFFDDWARDRTT